MSASQSQRWSLRLTLNLDTEHRRRTQQCHTASEHRVGRGMAHSVCAIDSARLDLFIHGIALAKRTDEVWPVILLRESSTQLVMYSLDTRIRYLL